MKLLKYSIILMEIKGANAYLCHQYIRGHRLHCPQIRLHLENLLPPSEIYRWSFAVIDRQYSWLQQLMIGLPIRPFMMSRVCPIISGIVHMLETNT